ncbi:MAG: EAL domain-containing protein [Steroidobacteraceae bacterium]
MSESAAVSVVVVSSVRDPVEALNSLLRRNGVPAHCTWIPAVVDLPDALTQLNPQLLICVTNTGSELPLVARVREVSAPELPLLVIRPELSEEAMSADLALGARDTLTLSNPVRVHAVCARELKAFRMERAMNETLHSAHEYRKQLETVLTRSHDAIAQVQEGILVEVNRSWLDLVGAVDADAVIGQPIMDFFDEGNHAALKGGLVACLQGRWKDHSLRADVHTADGSTLPLELVLTLGSREGEPCVRLMVPTQKQSDAIATDLSDAIRRNPRSGLLHRQPLLEAIEKRIATPLQGGSRYLLYVRPDKFAKLERDMGALHSEEYVAALAAMLRSQLGPTEIAGHFSGAGMMLLLERGTARDAELWAERMLDKVAQFEFEFAGRKFRSSVCIGVAAVPNAEGKLDATISDAQEAVRRGRSRGGNQICAVSRADNDARVQSYDAVWIKHIRAALTENRFRLVQQPVASLAGGAETMFDILIRMLDRQDKEILPSEFMPAAARNDLVAHIDRWVILAAARFAVRTKPGCLFVRLSRASALDATLPAWVAAQLQTLKLDPRHLCIQITEEHAMQHPTETRKLARGLKEAGIRFALEHYGTGIDPLSLLDSLPLDFIKIDGSLMQGLSDDTMLQSKVSTLVDAARERGIETIAERVEDANTMAVLWQLGVQHLQGFLIQAPEEVVMSTPDGSTTQQEQVLQVLNTATLSTLR